MTATLKDPYIGLFSFLRYLMVNYVWHFRLGYSAMQVEDWKTGARAYREYCSFDSEVRVKSTIRYPKYHIEIAWFPKKHSNCANIWVFALSLCLY